MSLQQEYQERARIIHQRLVHPPNAVPDPGIDLKRLKSGMTHAEKKIPQQAVLEHHSEPLPTQASPPLQLELPLWPKTVPFHTIVMAVSKCFSISRKDLFGHARYKEFCIPRHVMIYLASIHTKMSGAAIGRKLGRDHTTIIAALRRNEKRMRESKKLCQTVVELQEKLLG